MKTPSKIRQFRMFYSLTAGWKVNYEKIFFRTSKRNRSSITKINRIRDRSKAAVVLYGAERLSTMNFLKANCKLK